MKKPFLISTGVHFGIIIFAYAATVLSAPMKPPQKIYSVKIIAAPRPNKPAVLDDQKSEQEKTHTTPDVKGKPKNTPVQKPKSKSQQNPQKTTAHGTATMQIEGKDFSDDFYLNLIITKVANNWLNPLRGGNIMRAVIFFRVMRNGEVTEAKVEEKSGNDLFDQSALRAVLTASPMPPLPESYTGDFLGVHFQFEHTGRR